MMSFYFIFGELSITVNANASFCIFTWWIVVLWNPDQHKECGFGSRRVKWSQWCNLATDFFIIRAFNSFVRGLILMLERPLWDNWATESQFSSFASLDSDPLPYWEKQMQDPGWHWHLGESKTQMKNSHVEFANVIWTINLFPWEPTFQIFILHVFMLVRFESMYITQCSGSGQVRNYLASWIRIRNWMVSRIRIRNYVLWILTI